MSLSRFEQILCVFFNPAPPLFFFFLRQFINIKNCILFSHCLTYVTGSAPAFKILNIVNNKSEKSMRTSKEIIHVVESWKNRFRFTTTSINLNIANLLLTFPEIMLMSSLTKYGDATRSNKISIITVVLRNVPLALRRLLRHDLHVFGVEVEVFIFFFFF